MNGVQVTGAKVLFKIPILGGIPITETVVNTWIVMALLVIVSIVLTRGLKIRPTSKRQIIAEYLVGMVNKLVHENMGAKFMRYVPFIGALFSLSMFSSLISLVGMYSPTGDLSTCLAWALLVFVLITYYKIRTQHIGGYLKGFTEPVFMHDAAEHHRRGGDAHFHGVQALWQYRLGRGGHPAYIQRSVRAVYGGAGAHSGRVGAAAQPDPDIPGGAAGGALALLRCVHKRFAGVHFLHADDDVYSSGMRGMT